MADAQRHTEAWRDKPWKQFNGSSSGSKSAYTEPAMVPMTRATCTEEPYDSKRITYGSGTAGGGATRLLTVTPLNRITPVDSFRLLQPNSLLVLTYKGYVTFPCQYRL